MALGLIGLGSRKEISDPLKDVFRSVTGQASEDASIAASERAAAGYQDAIDYLRESQEVPIQYRDEALSVLAGLSGLPSSDFDQASFYNSLTSDPLYSSMIREGEDAAARQASVTGLRGGNTAGIMAQIAPDALNRVYENRVNILSGLAGRQGSEREIANLITGQADTLAQGDIAGAQARQQATGNLLNLGSKALGGFI